MITKKIDRPEPPKQFTPIEIKLVIETEDELRRLRRNLGKATFLYDLFTIIDREVDVLDGI